MNTIGIKNAAWWLPHSTVVLKADYQAKDEAWILNSLVSMDGTNAVQMTGKHKDILTVQRMTQPGSVVAVQREEGRVLTVRLPDEAEELLWTDVEYINAEIEKLKGPPLLTQEQQAAFLEALNGATPEHLTRVK